MLTSTFTHHNNAYMTFKHEKIFSFTVLFLNLYINATLKHYWELTDLSVLICLSVFLIEFDSNLRYSALFVAVMKMEHLCRVIVQKKYKLYKWLSLVSKFTFVNTLHLSSTNTVSQ